MKMHVEQEVILGNAGKAQSFTIAANAKAFQILSSGIYKHKIRAVVREVICNANDAHIIANNQDTPFIIKAPNELDPRFVVRDFGPGLDEEDMTTIYTQYFASTKADCDRQTGAFGLGAKSPFSYTDTFTVASYHAGICTIYNAMLSGGEPQLVKVYSGPYEEGDKDGIEVTVPCKIDDIPKWHNELVRILRPFPKSAYQVLGVNLDILSLYDLRGYNDDWFATRQCHIIENKRMSVEPNGVYAIYGSIVYPLNGVDGVDASWLRTKSDVTYIHFASGELMPQPSREELQFDERTLKNVRTRVNTLNEQQMAADIASLQKITNRRELLRKLHNLPGSQYSILESKGIKFLGMTIKELNKSVEMPHLREAIVNHSTVYIADKYSPKVRKLVEPSSYRRLKVSETSVDRIYTYTNRRAWIIICDTTMHKTRAAIKGLCHSTEDDALREYDHVLVVQNSPSGLNVINEIKSVMGDDIVHVYKSSEMEDIRKLVPGYGVKKPRTAPAEKRPASPNAEVMEYNEKRKSWDTKLLYLTSNEIKELNGYVLGLYRDNVSAKSFNFSTINNLSQYTVRDILAKQGITKLYLVRPSIYKRVSANSNLICAFKDMCDLVIKLLTDFPESKYSFSNTSTFIQNVLSSEKLVKSIIPLLTAPRSEEAVEMHRLFKKVRDIRIIGGSSYPGLNDAIVLYNERHIAAENAYKKKLLAFREKHPTIYYVLDNKYSLDDHMINDIVKLLGT
ncbi:RIIA lysis inhibitor [Acinetobacter phage ZZ1]|uniref:Protector from prophage-induced early lysis n=1 Tax=Acinetobacter phage ZZ1 TaxID=1049283 RepID=I3WVX0_9CAUD|nr:RIIA lysis inhibitor [Acinetobacter phage ZZ1]AFL47640.1 protector from prophage-induced early lysis [Acinetobacter phage ZZ1]